MLERKEFLQMYESRGLRCGVLVEISMYVGHVHVSTQNMFKETASVCIREAVLCFLVC
jgi:hypothetical protein